MTPDLDTLVERVLDLPGERVVLGIAGAPGAGKTTLSHSLASALAGRLGAAAVGVVPLDGFHLADVALDLLGTRDRKGAPETFDAEGYSALLARAREGSGTVWAPAFDRTLEQPVAGSVRIGPEVRVVVTEGNYLLLPRWVEARALMEQTWFCRVDPEVRIRRLVARHVQFGKTPEEAAAWVERVDGPNADLVEASAPQADLLVTDP